MLDGSISEALTFDDVLLLPARSAVLPTQVDTRTLFSRNISLNIPITSAAMDTVTDARLAIALAQQGGIGIVHRSMPIDRQALEIDKQEIMKKYKISGVPVTSNGKLVGILTNRDLRFETRFDLAVEKVMTKENLITVPVGTTLEDAEEILHRHRVEKLLVVDDTFHLKGLITVKDIQKKIKYPNAAKDGHGRLRVGAAVGATGDFLERAQELVRAQVDVIVVDTAHGHSSRVLEAVRLLKTKLPEVDLVAGNVATAEGACDLVKLGVDGVKVGVGPGSICTTRIVTGAGVPQITAIGECVRATSTTSVPVVADGGVKFSGDVTKAIAAGASAVMIGSLFAGTEESPGETILYQGRSFKSYRGMGSLGAMAAGSGDRYAQEGEASKMVAEGIEGRVPYKGILADLVAQLVGGLRSGMGYCGCSTIAELQQKARFIRITSAGLRESHVHDVIITKEAPNYRLE